jgi:hypothetical protein
VLSRFGVGEKIVGMIDSYVWIKLDQDSDGTVTLGDVFLTAKYVTLEFPREVTRGLLSKLKVKSE